MSGVTLPAVPRTGKHEDLVRWAENLTQVLKRALSDGGASGSASTDTTGGGGGGADSFIGNVALLMHGDAIIDSGPLNIPITNAGAVDISTSTKKFGTGSLHFPGGASDYLRTTTSTGFDLGTGDFTIEFFLNLDGIGGSFQTIINDNSPYTDTGNWIILVDPNASIQFFNSNSMHMHTANGSVVAGTFQHHAAVRSGTTLTYFIDGVVAATATISTGETYGSAKQLAIGYQPGFGRVPTGYLDDLRVTKGVARYTSAFTPPTSSFPNS